MESTRVATLLLFTLTKYFAISHGQYIVDYTWVTSVDGKVQDSSVYCSNCEVICDVSYGCYDSTFYCTSGNCVLKCVGGSSCYGAYTYDTNETKLFNISCATGSSCPSRIYWKYPQSIVQLFTEENSDYGNYVEIVGPDYQGELKTWNQNCELQGSCKYLYYSLTETDVSLVCGESYSCYRWLVYTLSNSVVSIESSDTYAYWSIDDNGSGIYNNNKVSVHGDFGFYMTCSNTNSGMDNSIVAYDSTSVSMNCGDVKACMNNRIVNYDGSDVKISCDNAEACVNNTVAIHDSTVATWKCYENKACVNNTILVYDSAQIIWDCEYQYSCYNFTVIHMSESSTDNGTSLLLAN